MNIFASKIGTSAKEWIRYVGQLTILLSQTVVCAVTPPYKGVRSLIQAQRIGPGSFIISALVAFFVGMIIALQMAYQMVQLSAELYIPNVIAVALTRELTPDFSGQERTPALFLVARARRPQWSARARIRCVFGQRQVRSVCCNSTIKAKANLRPSGYERATLPEKVSNYWHSHARSGTSVRVWLRRFIGYPLVGSEIPY